MISLHTKRVESSVTEFLKMGLQLIPKSVKEWLKLKIRHAVGQDNLFPSPLTLTVKYIPNQSGSVFTHIDDLAEAWLLELKRILSPQGRLYITIHDAHTIKLLDTTEKETNLAKEMRSNSLYRKVKDNFGMLVIGRDAQSQIFYDIDYFCKTLNSMFDILSVTEEAYGYQTAILLQKK